MTPHLRQTHYEFVGYDRHFLPLGMTRSGQELRVLRLGAFTTKTRLVWDLKRRFRYIWIRYQIYSPSDYRKFSLFFF